MVLMTAVQCNEEQYVHSAATSATDSLTNHWQTQQEASAITPADVSLSQHQRPQQGQAKVHETGHFHINLDCRQMMVKILMICWHK